MNRLATTFTGLEFDNPFVLASAPPTESKRKILKAFEAGWGGVVTKTIGLHPVENVAGPKTIFQRTSDVKPYVSRNKRQDTVSHSSWNWELISDQPLELWLPDLEEIKTTYPDRMLIASIMAGAGSEEEMENWRKLARACVNVGCDAIELNMSCPHMDRKDMGANIANDEDIIRDILNAVTSSVSVPIWVKLKPATSTLVAAAGAAYDAGAASISLCNTFPSLPLMDPET
ncbi:MAG: tRNA-dihydrouridine synthase, partial [Litoreibacter sp.]|nr:tRNA-dihydrouridine synthase [Litoreibacter sp.]